MPSFEVNIISKDDPSGIQSATEETIKYTDAVGKALEADRKRSENASARAAVKNMSDEEKAAALAAYQLASAQDAVNNKIGTTQGVAGNFSGAVVGIKNAWMEASAAIQVAQTAIQVGEQVYTQTIGTMVEYGDKIRELTQLTGTTAESSSRLFQVADDLDVSYEALSKSMEYLAKHGINPTIDSIAVLSDQYLSLGSQVEKNTFVFENFGKSGMDVVNILEQGSQKLMEMNGAVNQAQILTDAQIVQLIELKKAQNEFNDELEIEKLRIANDLLPLWKWLLDLQIKYSNAREKFLAWIGVHNKVADSAKDAADAVQEEATAINNLHNKKVTVETELKLTGKYYDDYMANFLATHPGYTPGQTAPRASGGPVKAGNAYWVGEEGPEPFIPNQDGTIISNKDAREIGKQNVNVTIQMSSLISLANQAEAERILAPIIRDVLRQVANE